VNAPPATSADTPVDMAWRGLLLAGGRSSRMGRDKAWLPWQGKPLWRWTRDLLLDAGAREVVVSGDLPDAGGVPDPMPGGGPAAALAHLAPRLADGDWLVVPVDMPHLSPALLHALLRPAAACVGFRRHPLPMRLRLDARSRGVLAALATRTGRACSLQRLQDDLEAARLDDAPWQDALANCNTPEEWRRASETPRG